MSTTSQYYLHGILLPTGAWISQLTDTTPASNVQQIVEYAAGAAVPSFRGAHGARPDVSFTSTQIGTILAACGMWGADLSAGNCDLFYRQGANLSTRAALATSSHLRIRAVRAMLYWESITAKQGDLATIRCRLVPTFDGINPPLVATGSTTIASQPLAVAPYTLGPVALNGVALDALAGWTLSLNPTLNEKASGGDSWTSFCGISRHDPVLEIQPENLGCWSAIDRKAGLFIFGQSRYRDGYDYDKDGFTDIPQMNNKTIGLHSYLKTSDYSKLSLEYHNISDYRRGGNLLNLQPHEADVAEEAEHSINGGGVNYDRSPTRVIIRCAIQLTSSRFCKLERRNTVSIYT